MTRNASNLGHACSIPGQREWRNRWYRRYARLAQYLGPRSEHGPGDHQKHRRIFRIGWNRGQNESFEFTDTNWTATFGTSIKGEKWKQPDDVIGAAFIASGISTANQAYLADGGLGILTGDGALTYGPEKNIELYYDHKFSKYFFGTVDYQFVDDPAFNTARGPVPGIFGIRLHFER